MSTIVRKNIETMPESEWLRFAAALNEYKASGEYDRMTQHHALAMSTLTVSPGETGTQRNVAHRGPAFFPWHREALRELELALFDVQSYLYPFDSLVGIPYWRWNVNRSTWTTTAIWNRVGGNGDPTDGYKIKTGPFSGWTSTIATPTGFVPRAGIIRQFLATTPMPSWDTSTPTYDSAPWSENSTDITSFRRNMEGKHNRVHINVGGDMTPATSPNDPLFWFHHCNCDRAWASWQKTRGITTYQPNGEGPSGHNKLDVPIYLDSALEIPPKTNGDMLDRLNFDWPGNGFTYDTLVP